MAPPTTRARRIAGSVWTSPNTLLGLLLGALTFQRPRIVEHTIAFDKTARGTSQFLVAIHRSAMTVGDVIISAEPLRGVLLTHEQEHVRQYHRWGPAFIPAYLLLWVRFGYRRHPFELAAERVARGEPTPGSR